MTPFAFQAFKDAVDIGSYIQVFTWECKCTCASDPQIWPQFVEKVQPTHAPTQIQGNGADGEVENLLLRPLFLSLSLSNMLITEVALQVPDENLLS